MGIEFLTAYSAGASSSTSEGRATGGEEMCEVVKKDFRIVTVRRLETCHLLEPPVGAWVRSMMEKLPRPRQRAEVPLLSLLAHYGAPVLV